MFPKKASKTRHLLSTTLGSELIWSFQQPYELSILFISKKKKEEEQDKNKKRKVDSERLSKLPKVKQRLNSKFGFQIYICLT